MDATHASFHPCSRACAPALVLPDDTEPVSKRVSTEASRHWTLIPELPFHRASSRAHLLENRIEVLDVEVDMHGGPVPLVVALFFARRRESRAASLFVHANGHVVGVENGHRRERA